MLVHKVNDDHITKDCFKNEDLCTDEDSYENGGNHQDEGDNKDEENWIEGAGPNWHSFSFFFLSVIIFIVIS